MTRDDIIRIARQASYTPFCYFPQSVAEMERFAALVAAASEAKEREACVRRAEVAMLGADRELTLRLIAAIRARGQA